LSLPAVLAIRGDYKIAFALLLVPAITTCRFSPSPA